MENYTTLIKSLTNVVGTGKFVKTFSYYLNAFKDNLQFKAKNNVLFL
jgi:hypothetical protein